MRWQQRRIRCRMINIDDFKCHFLSASWFSFGFGLFVGQKTNMTTWWQYFLPFSRLHDTQYKYWVVYYDANNQYIILKLLLKTCDIQNAHFTVIPQHPLNLCFIYNDGFQNVAEKQVKDLFHFPLNPTHLVVQWGCLLQNLVPLPVDQTYSASCCPR